MGKCLDQITRISKLEGPEYGGPGFGGVEMKAEMGEELEEFGSLVKMDLQHRLEWLDECLSIFYEGAYDRSTDSYDTPLHLNFFQSLLCDFDGFDGQHTSAEFVKQFELYRRDMARNKKVLERFSADDETVDLSETEEEEEFDFMIKFKQVDSVFMKQLAIGGQKRKYCRANNGRVGWVPLHAQVGDLICVLCGGRVLHVLRPAPRGRYRLTGEAYVQGLMYGEALEMDGIETKVFNIE